MPKNCRHLTLRLTGSLDFVFASLTGSLYSGYGESRLTPRFVQPTDIVSLVSGAEHGKGPCLLRVRRYFLVGPGSMFAGHSTMLQLRLEAIGP